MPCNMCKLPKTPSPLCPPCRKNLKKKMNKIKKEIENLTLQFKELEAHYFGTFVSDHTPSSLTDLKPK